jgi:nicotinamide-nucleotide amidase
LPSIVDTLERWMGKTELLVFSGGLGPTHDDKTRYALAEYLKCGLSVDDVLYDRVAARFEGTSLKEVIERSRPIQGLVPVEARGVYNPAGSALGIHFERLGTRVWCFPGVPFEFKAMGQQELASFLSREKEESARAWKSVAVVGIPESLAVKQVPEVIADEDLHISVLPSFGLIEFVIRGEAPLVESAVRTMRERFAGSVLPEGCATLPEAILAVGREKGLTLSCAESCTGGLIGAALTDVPGSSAVFAGSAVTYSDKAKENLLGVEPALLDRYGAVSGECAESMARGALERYKTSLALAVTGVAGPEGGTEKSPVGTVWFGEASWVGSEIKSRSFVHRLQGDRNLVRERAARIALTAAWRRMCES